MCVYAQGFPYANNKGYSSLQYITSSMSGSQISASKVSLL